MTEWHRAEHERTLIQKPNTEELYKSVLIGLIIFYVCVILLQVVYKSIFCTADSKVEGLILMSSCSHVQQFLNKTLNNEQFFLVYYTGKKCNGLWWMNVICNNISPLKTLKTFRHQFLTLSDVVVHENSIFSQFRLFHNRFLFFFFVFFYLSSLAQLEKRHMLLYTYHDSATFELKCNDTGLVVWSLSIKFGQSTSSQSRWNRLWALKLLINVPKRYFFHWDFCLFCIECLILYKIHKIWGQAFKAKPGTQRNLKDKHLFN